MPTLAHALTNKRTTPKHNAARRAAEAYNMPSGEILSASAWASTHSRPDACWMGRVWLNRKSRPPGQTAVPLAVAWWRRWWTVGVCRRRGCARAAAAGPCPATWDWSSAACSSRSDTELSLSQTQHVHNNRWTEGNIALRSTVAGEPTYIEATSPITSQLLLLLHLFNGPFSRTTWVSRCQKGKTSLNLNEARDDGVLGWQWHQLDHMQTTCTSLQTDNHTKTSSLNFYRLFLTPNQQCQSR